MSKIFNINAVCLPNLHYMVDITGRLKEIKVMVDRGDYFTINRGRQYGKTTTLRALEKYLQEDYLVIRLDFQGLSTATYESEDTFAASFAGRVLRALKEEVIPETVRSQLVEYEEDIISDKTLTNLFDLLSEWCASSDKPIVLMIDEVDAASGHQIFLDFLALLRQGYINRDVIPTFQSVILAGVQDIKHIKRKLRPESSHEANSPWNTHESNEENASLLAFDDCPWDQMELAPFDIAADFLVNMSFSADDIAGMLQEYEKDCATGMDISAIASLIYEYTSGYPVLVSNICKYTDERIAGTSDFPTKTDAWTHDGILAAIDLIYDNSNMLFESLQDKLDDYPSLREMLYSLLMEGQPVPFNRYDPAIADALMYGFIRIENKRVVVANRIFKTQLYETFLASPETRKSEVFLRGDREKYQFITDDGLNMQRILERFVVCFDESYGDDPAKFLEDDGRRYFLLYLRPIINGTGNYYIEAQTRNQERTDVIIDYLGRQYIVELKLWRGNSYNERGEKQLTDYLYYYHLDKGYMLSFNFNQKKEIGVKEITLGDKVLIEAVV